MSSESSPAMGWVGPVEPRIAPARGFVGAVAGLCNRLLGRPEPPNIMLTLQRSPRLFWPWLCFASRFMLWSNLGSKDRERVILRVAWNCRCRYEWGQHRDFAARLGIEDTEIARIIIGPSAAWEPRQQALLSACDELHEQRCISEETWAALSAHYAAAELLEICFLIGHYAMVAGFLNSVGVRLEALR